MKKFNQVAYWSRSKALRFGGAAVALVATGSAMAQTTTDDFSTSVLSELSGGHTQVFAICSAIIGIVAVILLYRLVRKAA